MSAYSNIGAYGLAITLRSAKTILVEGQTDKRILSRMILQRHLEKNTTKQTCVIDECAIVGSDARLAGKGSKEKVEGIASALGHLSGKLNWLVDREWEGIDVEQPSAFSTLPSAEWGWRTKGHSIENYWLREHVLRDYLKMCLGAELPAIFFVQLSERFEFMVRLAAAYSFAARRLNVITRAGELIQSTDISWTGARYETTQTLNMKLEARGLSVDLNAEVHIELNKPRLQESPHGVLQWLCHGHLGEEMVRACTANLSADLGVARVIIERIERGAKAEKLAHDAGCLACLDGHAIEPLADLVDWAQ